MIRVLYAGAADLARPNAGLDLASRCHFEEVSTDPRLVVTAISVSPLPLHPDLSPRYPARLFASDMLAPQSGATRLRRKLALLARGGVLFHTGLISAPAQAALATGLAANPNVLLIDNVGVLANLALLRLALLRLRGRTKIMVIAHDASAEVLRDRAGLHPSRWRARAIRLHALHCHLYESVIFALANRVVFLSRRDRERFRFLPAAKTDALCLFLDEPEPHSSTPDPTWGRYLVFIGSPVFFANAFALEWLITRFAPLLRTAMPDVKIVLIGKGTDDLPAECPPNVVGLGFVDADELHRRLHYSCGMLSPVIHGSGIKIKVVEALAAGCPVFSTESSLRGYEFMDIEALIDIDDPAGTADRIGAIIGNPARLAAERQHIQTRWADYKRDRRGKLADAVHALATPHP